MAGEWQSLPLSEIIDIISGGTPKTSVQEYWGGDIPWLSVADFNTGYRWVSVAEKTITERGLNESATEILQPGDVIVSARGTVGVVAQVAVAMAFNQSCYGIRGKPDVSDTNFVYYALRHAVSQMKRFAHGGVFDTITRDTFSIVETDLPPIDEQRAIAHILGTLDDKIELNRRMNQTLESIARATFKSWFVDFDPVRAKAEGRQPAGMDAETAALFPDSFADSSIGKVPSGWHVASLDQVIEINPARHLRKGDVAPFLEMKNMSTSGHRPVAFQKRAFTSGTRFINGDTLVARITPCLENGKTAYVDFLEDGQTGWGSTEYIVLRPKPPLPSEYGYFLARSEDFRLFAVQNMTGTSGRQRVQTSSLSMYLLAVPSEGIARAFSRLVEPAIQLIRSNDIQANTLAGIRDTLLPKLISGQIRVIDAEKFLEEHAC